MKSVVVVGGVKLIANRIIGWKRSTNERHDTCIDIYLDSGSITKVPLYLWNMDRQGPEWQEYHEEAYKLAVDALERTLLMDDE